MCKNIVDILGLIIAVVALLVSCQANNISKTSQRKLERLECYDKVDTTVLSLTSSYRESLISGTRIFNYLPKKWDVTGVHTTFQIQADKSFGLVKKIKQITRRLDFICNEKVQSIFSEIEKIRILSKKADLNKNFSEFSSEKQNAHSQNISWLLEANIAEMCCTN